MELEKFYNYSIKNLTVAQFKCVSDSSLSLSLFLYFSKSHVSLLGWVLLNLVSYNKTRLVFHRKTSTDIIPIGVNFVNYSNFFTFVQKIILFFLGASKNLNTSRCKYFANGEVIFPLPNNFSDLLDLNSLDNNISYIGNPFLLFFGIKLPSFNKQLSEYILRLFKLPLILIK